MLELGEKIRIIRNILGLKQEEIASAANISRSYLANIEAKKTVSFPFEIIVFLQKKFGINPDYFLENSVQIFVDSEKAIPYLKNKSFYNIYEVFYILSQIQNIYSLFDEFLVKKEFTRQIIEVLQKFSLCEIHEITRFEKAIENEAVAWGRLMDEMIACVTNYIVERDFNIPEELHKELQNLIFDWGIYVFIAAAMHEKYKFIPLESIYVEQDILRNIQKLKETEYEKQIPRVVVEREGIKLVNFYGHFVLDFSNKGFIELEKEKLFGFISVILSVKNDEKKRVLDYEFFYTEIEKLANLKQKDITLSLSLEEFESLRECFRKIKENTKLWQWLQVHYVEKYGFV
ncbi:helix-turn-helix domain-containing protein [Thermodesulfovibrio yellowstonii]|uniref:helix-turn-helix domain-containing protein n=1 Tax=Thermodesulfovibrio yellowstonii TaxID=28262 RepID=UPI0024B32DFB|nr:helix-turn-helix transcriptional regulator [Thermodesulfovibrio yellowstonii]MDI6864645.1 helix-turn-helix transcriptional regulator [Thermodesulfovibrio yellowstonii]